MRIMVRKLLTISLVVVPICFGQISGDPVLHTVTLGTNTDGNYVATVAGSNSITVTGAEGEGSTKTAAFDYTATNASSPGLAIGECVFTAVGGGGILCEGGTVDGFEVTLAFSGGADAGGDKLITIPGATDNLVGRQSNDTLLNKSMSGDSNTFTNIAPASLTAAARDVSKAINIFTPTTADTNKIQFDFPQAVTIQEIHCSTDVGTVTIQLDERVKTTPNTAGTNVMTASLVCDSDDQSTTAFDNAGIAADAPVNLQITATATSPTIVRIHVQATRD